MKNNPVAAKSRLSYGKMSRNPQPYSDENNHKTNINVNMIPLVIVKTCPRDIAP